MVKSYERSQMKHEKSLPRSEAAKRKHGSFLSAASRFAPPRDVVYNKTDPDVPGRAFQTLSISNHCPAIASTDIHAFVYHQSPLRVDVFLMISLPC